MWINTFVVPSRRSSQISACGSSPVRAEKAETRNTVQSRINHELNQIMSVMYAWAGSNLNDLCRFSTTNLWWVILYYLQTCTKNWNSIRVISHNRTNILTLTSSQNYSSRRTMTLLNIWVILSLIIICQQSLTSGSWCSARVFLQPPTTTERQEEPRSHDLRKQSL